MRVLIRLTTLNKEKIRFKVLKISTASCFDVAGKIEKKW
jgi:hypothetical protein